MDSADFYFPPLFSMKKQEKKKIYLTWYLFVFFSCTHAAIKSRKVSDGACPTSSLPGSIPALYCAVHYYTVITSKLWLHFWHFLSYYLLISLWTQILRKRYFLQNYHYVFVSSNYSTLFIALQKKKPKC